MPEDATTYKRKPVSFLISAQVSKPAPPSGTGFYSTEDYREILRHAKERHIQVIPEFDLPGHSHAAIKSKMARHDRLVKA